MFPHLCCNSMHDGNTSYLTPRLGRKRSGLFYFLCPANTQNWYHNWHRKMGWCRGAQKPPTVHSAEPQQMVKPMRRMLSSWRNCAQTAFVLRTANRLFHSYIFICFIWPIGKFHDLKLDIIIFIVACNSYLLAGRGWKN